MENQRAKTPIENKSKRNQTRERKRERLRQLISRFAHERNGESTVYSSRPRPDDVYSFLLPPLHRAGLPFDHGNCRNFCRGSLVSLFFHASPPPPPPGSCRRNVGGTRGQGGEFLSAFGSLARSPPPCPEGMGERVREKGRGGDDRLEISGWSRARDKRYGSSATWATINFSHEVRSLSSSPPPPRLTRGMVFCGVACGGGG